MVLFFHNQFPRQAPPPPGVRTKPGGTPRNDRNSSIKRRFRPAWSPAGFPRSTAPDRHGTRKCRFGGKRPRRTFDRKTKAGSRPLGPNGNRRDTRAVPGPRLSSTGTYRGRRPASPSSPVPPESGHTRNLIRGPCRRAGFSQAHDRFPLGGTDGPAAERLHNIVGAAPRKAFPNNNRPCRPLRRPC